MRLGRLELADDSRVSGWKPHFMIEVGKRRVMLSRVLWVLAISGFLLAAALDSGGQRVLWGLAALSAAGALTASVVSQRRK